MRIAGYTVYLFDRCLTAAKVKELSGGVGFVVECSDPAKEDAMTHMVIDANDIEPQHGVFRGLSTPLGVGAFKVNRLEMPPGGEGPEHDHAADNEEEVYAVVGGSGMLRIDGEEVQLRPGQFVFCSPEARRQMVAGDEGLVWIGIGATRSA